MGKHTQAFEGIASIPAQATARVSEQAPQAPDLPHVCAICGAEQTVMVEMDFRYTPQGVLYCGSMQEVPSNRPDRSIMARCLKAQHIP